MTKGHIVGDDKADIVLAHDGDTQVAMKNCQRDTKLYSAVPTLMCQKAGGNQPYTNYDNGTLSECKTRCEQKAGCVGFSFPALGKSAGCRVATGDTCMQSSSDASGYTFYFKPSADACTKDDHWGEKLLTSGSGANKIKSGDVLDDIIVGDVNGDGSADLVTVARTADDAVRWYNNTASGHNQGDGTTFAEAFFISDAPTQENLNPKIRFRLALLDINPNTPGVDVVATSPGNGRLYAFKNPNQAGKSWVQLSVTSKATAVTSLAVSDVDGDGRNDVIASTSTHLGYWLTCGGNCKSSDDGETWAKHIAHDFTGTCDYDRNETCVSAGGNFSSRLGTCSKPAEACVKAGGNWNSKTQMCTEDTDRDIWRSASCYENTGVRTGMSSRGWVAPTMIATANVAGDSNVDIMFGSDSSPVHSSTGYVGAFEQLSNTCS